MIGNFDLELNEYKLYSYQNYDVDHSLRTTIRLVTPSLHFCQYQRDNWGGWYRELGVRAPTTFIFQKAEFFWSLNIVLLGFGISFAHQNGY